MNILVIGAHYDDAELGAGGTMAKLAKAGHNVYKLTLTDNETHFEQKGIHIDAQASAVQSASACKILGVKEVDFEPVACSYLRYSTATMQRVEKVVYDLQIDTGIFHYREDMNEDHVEASRICLTALRHCRNLLMYQSNAYVLAQPYNPTFFVDISDTFEAKKEALACYRGGHDREGRLFETVLSRNEIWGFSNKIKAAEGFQIVKAML